MVSELPSAPQQTGNGGATTLTPLSQLRLGENVGGTVAVKVVVAVPQTGMRLVAALVLIVADANEDLMALTIYALRGVPTLEAGTTLEIRDPQLLQIEATKFWERAPDGTPAASAGYHLLRVENPGASLRINGHPVGAKRPASAARGSCGARGVMTNEWSGQVWRSGGETRELERWGGMYVGLFYSLLVSQLSEDPVLSTQSAGVLRAVFDGLISYLILTHPPYCTGLPARGVGRPGKGGRGRGAAGRGVKKRGNKNQYWAVMLVLALLTVHF